MKQTKGGYAPTENTPFRLFRKEAGKEKPVVSKKEKTAANKSEDEVYMEKVAPGVEVPVPGLTKEGKLKKHMSYGEVYMQSDMDEGLSDDEIVKKLTDRYPDIPEDEARKIVENVRAGIPNDWRDIGAGLTREGKLKKKSDRAQEAKGKVEEYVRAGDSEANAMVRVIEEMQLTEAEEAQLWGP